MFKKLYFKISLILSLSVLIISIFYSFISSLLFYNFYYSQLEKEVNNVIESNFISSFNRTVCSDLDENLKLKGIEDTFSQYFGVLSVDENRKAYILKGEDLSVLVPIPNHQNNIEITENISSSSINEKGNTFSYFADYIDYAVSFNSSDGQKYILYVRDNKTEIRAFLLNNIKNILIFLIPSIIISLIVAYLISLKIKKPLKKLTSRAEGFEKGELYENLEDIKTEEFIALRDAINHMGFVMAESIRLMNSDKNKVEVILEHINNGIITFDVNQKPIHFNSASKRILKIKDDEEIIFDDFFKKLGLDICMAEFLYLDKSKTIEKEIKKDEGYIKAWFIPFKMDSERNAGVVCVFEDITEQFNLMQSMRKFVADVSHELKTPISVISSYTETVLNLYLDDKAMASNLLNIVYQETGKMTELVRNLLDISKFETGAVPVKKEPFSIDEMISYLVKTFEIEAEKKELKLSYNRMTDIPMFIGNRSDIERAVKNIISNSVKYTSKGDKISIFAGKLHNEIYIKIEDTGWGIPENKLGHLFERFYRVEEEARSRDKGGTGLGLSIAKEIIESYGGKIKIESEYTKYTRVTITLPVPK